MKKITFEKCVLSFTFLVSVSAIFISYKLNLLLSYNDATAHLNTARRVVDSLTPGFTQLGSVWLPLLHILELPFVMNFFLWQSGLAGSIVSGISFIVAAFFLYKLLYFVTKNQLAAFIGVLVLSLNINLLYMQTTAMFEPLLLATALGSIYFLNIWTKTSNIQDLIKAAFFTMLATLTRYDGWALFLGEVAFVFLYSFVYKKQKNEGAFIIFLFLAGFGIFLWFLYNYTIFSDPLYFMRGEYSAAAQQHILYLRGQLPTEKNLPLAFLTYSISMVLNLGILPTIFMILGLLVFIKNKIMTIPEWVPFILLIPYAFNIISLYLGQSVIWLPMVPPHFSTYFNARYGILMIPAAAFFAGYFASKSRIIAGVIALLVLIQVYLFFNPAVLPLFGYKNGIITLQDTVSSVNIQTVAASSFLHAHYSGGLILVSSASEDSFIFRTGLPLKDYITEGTGSYWKQSLKDPRTYATWLVYFQDKTDRVGRAIGNSKIVADDYKKMYADKTYQMYIKK